MSFISNVPFVSSMFNVSITLFDERTYSKVLLLCSEPTPECCHRRLLAEYLKNKMECNVIHI